MNNNIYAVYIMGNDRPTLYTGVTNNLYRRIFEHKNKDVEGFTKRYNLNKLLYYETFDTVWQSIIREKQIKNMKRNDKLFMIRRFNPDLNDLYEQISIF